MPVASYISYVRSNDVVNALRVALCPRETVDSDKCPECKTRECDFAAGVRDREIFSEILAPGEGRRCSSARPSSRSVTANI